MYAPAMPRMHLALLSLFLILLPRAPHAAAQPPAAPAPAPPADHAAPAPAHNVILVMCDGFRWQELFAGADERLITKAHGVDQPDPLRTRFWRDTPRARREALLPFVWSTIASHGVIIGNAWKNAPARITNPHRVSYPGYSETLCGFPHPHIKDNRSIPNSEVTVFEWLHNRPGFSGKVAAFGAWNIFPAIFNAERCGFPVDDGLKPIDFGRTNESVRTVNTLRREIPRRWSASTFDALLFRPALEWMTLNEPRVMFVGLGETDEWGHEDQYDEYLDAAARFDGYLRELWATVQSLPAYKDRTAILVTCDHGRGGSNDDVPGLEGGTLETWRDHNAKVIGAERIWVMAFGAGVAALGEVRDLPEPVTQSQIAATLAALVGEDYSAAQPRAGKPIAQILARPHQTRP